MVLQVPSSVVQDDQGVDCVSDPFIGNDSIRCYSLVHCSIGLTRNNVICSNYEGDSIDFHL